MYDYDDFTLTINDIGDIFINEPGRRKRKLGLVGSRKVQASLRERDLACVKLWSYVDSGLRKLGLRSVMTLFGTRASVESIFRSPAEFETVVAFALDRAWTRKRWGIGDWNLIAEELIAHLERAIPLAPHRQTHHQEIGQRLLFSVSLESEDEADAFLSILAEMTTKYPLLLVSLGLKA